jgi:hypothetical protein
MVGRGILYEDAADSDVEPQAHLAGPAAVALRSRAQQQQHQQQQQQQQQMWEVGAPALLPALGEVASLKPVRTSKAKVGGGKKKKKITGPVYGSLKQSAYAAGAFM